VARPHHRLEVWKKGVEFVTQVYMVTRRLPADEKFGLIAQMRRAAVSIPSNIAEGAARNSKKEFINYLHIAQGSSAELETQIVIAQKLLFLSRTVSDKLLNDLDDISKMIIGLQRSLKRE